MSGATAERSGQVKAIGLLSGGLDSTLAARVLLEQGIEVLGINYSTGFCMNDHRRALGREQDDPRRLRNEGLRAGSDLVREVDRPFGLWPVRRFAQSPRRFF